MKLIAFMLFACVAFARIDALSQKFINDLIEKMTEIGGQCMEETHPNDDDISRLIARDLPQAHEGFCMLFCMHKAMQIQKEDGSLDLEGAINSLQELKSDDEEIYDKMKHIFDVCIPSITKEEDPCKTAINLGVCMKEESKKNGIAALLTEQ